MDFLKCLLLVSSSILIYVNCSKSSEATNEVWNYVTVRPKAHMFYWHYDTINSGGINNVPYVLWLQGGPGGSSTGFGNFGEIGPLDANLRPRNTTWLSHASLLFIDNPVGTGYSYVEDASAYTTDVKMIADDLLTVFSAVMMKLPHFQSVPFYIFSESYGGKMTAAFSQVLYNAIQAGKIKCNFKGFAMGDSWISPIDSVLTWGPYLLTNSLVDLSGFQLVDEAAKKTAKYVAEGQFVNATAEWSSTESVVERVTNGVNFYNILDWAGSEKIKAVKSNHNLGNLEKLWQRHVGVYAEPDLSALMNGPIRKKLGIIPNNVTWGGQSGMVFVKQQGDFMKPVTEIVDDLINNTPLSVVVYSGQLDLIVDTLGTEEWVNHLSIEPVYREAERKPILDSVTGYTSGFVKKAKNFSFYWILDAGHMVPSDNGRTAVKMLRMITGQE